MAVPVDVALAGEHLSNSLSLLFVSRPNAREWRYGKPAGDTNCLEILLEEEKRCLFISMSSLQGRSWTL